MKVIYWISTVIISVLMLFSAYNYFFNHAMVAKFFEAANYPIYIICPLALAKLSAIFVILLDKWKTLKEWAYAGLCFDFILATAAHWVNGDNGIGLPILALFFLFSSYFLGKKYRYAPSHD